MSIVVEILQAAINQSYSELPLTHKTSLNEEPESLLLCIDILIFLACDSHYGIGLPSLFLYPHKPYVQQLPSLFSLYEVKRKQQHRHNLQSPCRERQVFQIARNVRRNHVLPRPFLTLYAQHGPSITIYNNRESLILVVTRGRRTNRMNIFS